MEVKFDAQVAMKKNSNLVQKFFLKVAGGSNRAPTYFPHFWNCLKRVMSGLQVNIDKANSRRYDVIQYYYGMGEQVPHH